MGMVMVKFGSLLTKIQKQFAVEEIVQGGGTTILGITYSPLAIFGTATAWANQPSAVTEIFATTVRRARFDLTGFTKFKISCEMTVIGTSTAKIGIQYSSDNGTTWKAIDSDTTNAQSTTTLTGINTTGFKISAEGTIHANARGDRLVRLVGSEGIAVADPAFRNMVVRFYA